MTSADQQVGLEEPLADPPFWLTPSAYGQSPPTPVSAWMTHGPFASWLVDVLRPDVVVELGTHYGFSCFAFAAAAQRLGLPTKIHAVDTWTGDDHAGFYGQEVYEYVASVVAAEYPDQVRMVRKTFQDARAAFPDGSVDLLHIDGRHRYEDVVADYQVWRSAVRDGGVILFHDIAERKGDFGVWRLWDDLSAEGASFAFDHGHGLGVLAVGRVETPALRALFEADEPTAARIREDLRQLGVERETQGRLQWLTAETDRLYAELAQERHRVAERDEVVRSQRERIDALTASTSWRVTAPLRALGRKGDRQR